MTVRLSFLTVSLCRVFISDAVLRMNRNKTCDDEAKICPRAWHKINQNCVFLFQHENSWPVAQENCRHLNANLAKFNNKNELVRFPNEHAQQLRHRSFAFGEVGAQQGRQPVRNTENMKITQHVRYNQSGYHFSKREDWRKGHISLK